MKLVIAADLHGKWRDLEIPACDVLILPGDTLSDYHSSGWGPAGQAKQLYELYELDEWALNVSAKKVVCCGGNHDYGMESIRCQPPLQNLVYLEDNSFFFEGVQFWGTPWTDHEMMAFGKREDELKKKWSLIPYGVDVLITHMPPYGILDFIGAGYPTIGSVSLLERVKRIAPKIHCFGHAHQGFGIHEEYGIKFVNAAIKSSLKLPPNPPVVLEI